MESRKMSNYIIGLCLFMSIFISTILYKIRYDEYNNEKLKIKYNENLLFEKKEELEELKKINLKNNKIIKKYENLDDLKRISFTKNEIKKYIYELSVNNNLEILKISSEIIKNKYNKYFLKYIAIELKGEFINIYNYILSMNNNSKHIDFKDFSLYIKEDISILTIGYIERV